MEPSIPHAYSTELGPSFQTLPPESPQKDEAYLRHRKIIIPVFIFLTLLLFCLGYVDHLTTPPTTFIANTLVEIPPGYTLDEIALALKNASVIRAPLQFELLVQHYQKERGVLSGAYLFKTPLSVFGVAKRMAAGDRGIETFKVTLAEGLSSREMASILGSKIPKFNTEEFIASTKDKEGYLFPDTYFFFSVATSGEVVVALENNFTKRTKEKQEEANAMGKNWHDIVTMASIIEEETITDEDRHIVSGILWNRIKKGMRLQVDATFAYTIGKGSLELTADDLKSDSPYNTYLYKGLPPTPISNPGLAAIDAALHPSASAYLYYLSDKDGVIHYAKTFEEHKRNKAKYLK